MPQRNPEILDRIARAIADGEAIAWDEIDTESASPSVRGRLRNLHAIHALAQSSWGPVPEPDARDQGDAAPAPGPFHWGKLEVLSRIGEGSFGEVFVAYDPVLQREVALKLRRLERGGSGPVSHLEEARRLARVRHANVLTVHGIEEHDAREGMWTDYIRGRTLEEIVTEDGPFPAAEIERIGIDLCSALGAVHEAGLAHGDVKPANVMREDSGRIVLMDFGAGSNLVRTGRGKGPAAGTPLVMAPELFEGAPPSTASDIYAAGVLLYRLATGRYPVTATTQRELIARLREGTRVPVAEGRPDLAPHVAEAIDRALRIKPEERFPSAAAMRAFLEPGGSSAVRGGAGARAASRLPRETTRFIGREGELAEVRRLVLGHRLVTLVGAGGSGKTRMALRAAAGIEDAFADGARWVDLAAVQEADRIAEVIAHAVDVREEPRRAIDETLVADLSARSLLLVLDNCEHLRAPASALVRTLSARCPGLHIVVTSRVELGLPEERIVHVGPLPVPGLGTGAVAEGIEIAEIASVRLFIDRACAGRADFVLTPANAPAVARICRRVEGIPLAICLAAARVRVMDAEQIAFRLEESFRLLGGGSEELLPHQRTIEASIDWSYRLLTPAEQAMLRRVALFPGRWSLDAAERACAVDVPGTDAIDEAETFDSILSLVDKSLVLFEPADPGAGSDAALPCYRMLEMVRAFALARLQPGEEAAVRARQAAYYQDLVQRALPELIPAKEKPWIERFEAEHANLLAVLDWCVSTPDWIEAGMRIATSLRRYWLVCAYWREGRAILERLASTGAGGSEIRAKTYHAAASIAVVQGDYEATARLGDEALRGMRAIGDRKGIAQMLSILGIMAVDRTEYDLARERLEEALAIDREIGNTAIIPQRLSNLGTLAARMGNQAEAYDRFAEALALFRAVGDVRSTTIILGNLSTAARNLRRSDEALRLAEEHLAMARALGSKVELASAFRTVGLALLDAKNLDRARQNFLEALRMEKDIENRTQVVWCLEALVLLFVEMGDVERALRLTGAAEAFRAQLGTPLPEPDRINRTALTARLTQHLGKPTVDALLSAGGTMTWDEAIACATAE